MCLGSWTLSFKISAHCFMLNLLLLYIQVIIYLDFQTSDRAEGREEGGLLLRVAFMLADQPAVGWVNTTPLSISWLWQSWCVCVHSKRLLTGLFLRLVPANSSSPKASVGYSEVCCVLFHWVIIAAPKESPVDAESCKSRAPPHWHFSPLLEYKTHTVILWLRLLVYK